MAGDHAVDHAARRDDVGAGPRVAHRDAGEDVEGLVVQHVAGGKHRVLVVQHPAVAVVGVLAQAHVGDDEKLGQRVLQRTHGALDDAVVVEVLVADRILGGRDAEEQHRGDPRCRRPAGFLDRLVDGELTDPRHRRDRVTDVLAVHDEHRIDEIGRSERRLAHRRAELGGVAEAARPVAQRMGPESRLGIHGRPPGRWTGVATIARAGGRVSGTSRRQGPATVPAAFVQRGERPDVMATRSARARPAIRNAFGKPSQFHVGLRVRPARPSLLAPSYREAAAEAPITGRIRGGTRPDGRNGLPKWRRGG